MPDQMKDPVLANGAESDSMDRTAEALWAAMSKLVDDNPFYKGIAGPERHACVCRLAAQALLGVVVEHVDGGVQAQAYVMLSGLGRVLGQIVHLQGLEVQRCLNMLNNEMMIGARDAVRVSDPKGHA